MIRVLLTGDLMARGGRRVIEERLVDLRVQWELDFVVSNVENAAGGFSITPRIAQHLLSAGVDVMTSGNHIFDKKEILDYIPQEPRLLRPANYAPRVPGRATRVGKAKTIQISAINLPGRVFMPPCDDPFRTAEAQLAAFGPSVKIILLDMPAEATSETMGLAR